MGTGYSGIENRLFYDEDTRMFYGNAKRSLDSLPMIELSVEKFKHPLKEFFCWRVWSKP